MKIGVLFNCQHLGLAASLRALLPRQEVVSFGFPELDKPGSDAGGRALAALGGCDLVVSADNRNDLGPLSPRQLRKRVGKLILLPPVIFGGFHPDTCYATTGQVKGPTNAIHSRIAVAGFLAGLSIADTAALYNKLVFARLAYFDVFAQQRSMMLARYAAYDIDLAPWFDRWLAQGCFMYSVNHPKVGVLFDLARIVGALARLDPDPAASVPPDDLAYMPSHPVYPDLAQAFGVPAETLFHHVRFASEPEKLVSIDQYLTASFRSFSRAPRRVLREIDGVGDALRALDLAG